MSAPREECPSAEVGDARKSSPTHRALAVGVLIQSDGDLPRITTLLANITRRRSPEGIRLSWKRLLCSYAKIPWDMCSSALKREPGPPGFALLVVLE